MWKEGLLPKGFSETRISGALKDADLDREHWLVAYETVRHRFLKVCEAAVKSNPLFSQLLKQKVSFYRSTLPPYATVIHPGGAPEQIVANWMATLRGESPGVTSPPATEETPMLKLIEDDLARISDFPGTSDDTVSSLMEIPGAELMIGSFDAY
jgi:hypothetical protein